MEPVCFIKISNPQLLQSLHSILSEKGIKTSDQNNQKHDYAFIELEDPNHHYYYNTTANKTVFLLDSKHANANLNIPYAKVVYITENDIGKPVPAAADDLANMLFGFFNPSIEHVNLLSEIKAAPTYEEIREQAVEQIAVGVNPRVYSRAHTQERPYKKYAAAVFSTLCLPFLIFAFSIASLFTGFYTFDKIPALAEAAFSASEASSRIFGSTLGIDVVTDVAVVNKRFLSISRELGEFKTANNSSALKSLSLDLETLYKDISFLSAEHSNSAVAGVLGINTFEDTIELVSVAQLVSESLPQLIGDEWDEDYLVLFQDDSKLRSTGGVITHAAQFSIREGSVAFFKLYKAGDIDSKIEGTVEVPFDQADEDFQWHFSDVNWDISFAKTAEYARWFLDKSIHEDVEHILLFKHSALQDFSNYLQTENNVEVLSREIANNIFDIGFAGLLKQGLDSEKILAYSLDPKVAKLIESQNWGGKAVLKKCKQVDCIDISTNLFNFQTSGGEANLEFNVKPVLTSSYYRNNLNFDVEISNKASEIYEGYFTFAWNAISKVDSKRERISIPAGETVTKNIQVNYPFPDTLKTIYLHFGTSDDVKHGELKFSFINEKGGGVTTIPFLNLTKEGAFEYTTSLDQTNWIEINFN